MAYKVKKGKEKIFASARIFDGKRIFYGLLETATQEELEELFNAFPMYIEKTTTKKRKKKKRDNSPGEPIPEPPKD